MQRSFESKVQQVLEGKTTMLATSLAPSNAVWMKKLPGEDCGKRTMVNTGLGATIGLFLGACEVAWYPDPVRDTRGRVADTVTMRAILGRVAQPAVWTGLVAAAYTFTECSMESARQSKDSWNAVYAGMVAGFLIGTTTKRFDVATSTALGMGLLMGLADLTGPGINWERAHGIEPNLGVRPKKWQESEQLTELKEKYPKFKDL